MEENVKQKTEHLKEKLIKIRRKIHHNPELAFKEYKTTSLVKQELIKAGIKIVPLEIDTGVLGILEGEKEGSKNVIALRADMDALPIQEQTGLAYSSKNKGIMHACGHEGHTAILLGVAMLLSSMKNSFSSIVKFIFQPAEEILDGAKAMVKAGVLQNPSVDTILGLHSYPDMEVGKIGIRSGSMMAALDKFTVKISGAGGHAGYPYKNKDTIVASSTAVVQLQNIISRQIDACENAVLSVCTFDSGGDYNIMPEEVIFSGCVRYYNNEIGDIIKNKINNILKGISISFGCKYELEYKNKVPPVVNDAKIVESISRSATKILGDYHVEKIDRLAMGAEDFAVYLKEVTNGAYFRLGITNPGEEALTLHNDHFNFNDESIPTGVFVLVQYILDHSS